LLDPTFSHPREGPSTLAHSSGPGKAVFLAGIVAFSALVPLMPTNELKADFTLLSGLVLLLGLYLLWRERPLVSRSPLDLPLVVFLLTTTLATALSPQPLLSFVPSLLRGDGQLVYVVYILTAWAATRVRSVGVKMILLAVLTSATVISAVAVGQFYRLDPFRILGLSHLPYDSWRSFGTLT
jgi:hypothetical protein